MNPVFTNRSEAGYALGRQLARYAGSHPLVLALPRGGVPVGFEVASTIGGDLDVFIVRKLGVPGQEELAFGAIASGGVRVLNRAVLAEIPLSPQVIDRIATAEQQEIARREQTYREGRPPLAISGRVVIVVDDGLATGSTMMAAVRAVTQMRPTRLVIGVPVASSHACDSMANEVDEIICVATPEPFQAVGLWYDDFSQTTDEEVRELLRLSASRTHK